MDESKGGSAIAKPTEFFVGLVDLFSIVLPGGIAAVGLYGLYLRMQTPFPYIVKLQGAVPQGTYWPYWVALALASYLLGHFIFLLGSVFLDNLYDATYRKRKRESDAIQGRARLLLTLTIGLKGAEVDSALQWATAFARMRVPAAMLEVDRLEADSKFFRSLSVLILLADAAIAEEYASTVFTEVLAAILPLLVFLMTITIGRWRDRESRVRRIAFKLYSKRIRSGELLIDGESKDWNAANARVAFSERAMIFVLIGAVVAQIALGIVWTPGRAALLHLVAGALLFLSTWRFMERRLKRTVLTYRLFVASCLPGVGGGDS